MILLMIFAFIMTGSIAFAQSRDIIETDGSGNEEMRAERLAIVVGVNEYVHIGSLKYAVPDARLIAETLKDSGNFTVEYYADDYEISYAKKPTKENIMRAINSAGEAVERGWVKTLVVYFAGHGFEINGEHYLATLGTRTDDMKDSALSLKSIMNILETAKKTAKVIFFLDACRNDPTKRSVSDAWKDDIDSKGLAMLRSTSAGQYSYEVEDLGHGVYTYYLAKGLLGEADMDGNGYISYNELSRYMYYAMRDWSSTNDNKWTQIPKSTTDEVSGEFFITKTGESTINIDDPIDNDSDGEPRKADIRFTKKPYIENMTKESISIKWNTNEDTEIDIIINDIINSTTSTNTFEIDTAELVKLMGRKDSIVIEIKPNPENGTADITEIEIDKDEIREILVTDFNSREDVKQLMSELETAKANEDEESITEVSKKLSEIADEYNNILDDAIDTKSFNIKGRSNVELQLNGGYDVYWIGANINASVGFRVNSFFSWGFGLNPVANSLYLDTFIKLSFINSYNPLKKNFISTDFYLKTGLKIGMTRMTSYRDLEFDAGFLIDIGDIIRFGDVFGISIEAGLYLGFIYSDADGDYSILIPIRLGVLFYF